MYTQLHHKTGSQKRKRNSLEDIGPGTFPGSWVGSRNILPASSSHPNNTACSHFFCCFLPSSTLRNIRQQPGEVQNTNKVRKTWSKDLLSIDGFQAGSRQVHCCLKDGAGGGEVRPNTDVFWAFSQHQETRMMEEAN